MKPVPIYQHHSYSSAQTNYIPLKVKKETTSPGLESAVNCAECGKQYLNKGSLSRHMQTHTGNYKYTCHVCQKGYSRIEDYKDHIMKHEGKGYCCQYIGCGKSFRSGKGMKMHQSEHTGIFPFHCATCNQGFHLRAQLEVHENQHEGIGFQCLKCGKTLYSQKEFQKHREKCNK